MAGLATAVWCELLLLAASPVAVEFDGERYLPAFTGNQPGERLVEYVREGETVEKWTQLFAVRNFPQHHNPRAAVKAFEAVVKQHNPLAGVRVLVKADDTEGMIDFLTWETGGEYLEFNVHRYLKKPGYPGLVSYQFARRYPRGEEPTAEKLRVQREQWCAAMRELDPVIGFGK